jgi:hypothetical protein
MHAIDEYILTADYCSSGWVAVLTSLQILYLFKYDAEDEMLLLMHTIHSTMSFDPISGLLESNPEADTGAGAGSLAAKQGGKIVTVSLYSGELSLQAYDSVCVTPTQSVEKIAKLKRKSNDISPLDVDTKKKDEELFFYGSALSDTNDDSDHAKDSSDTAANTPDEKNHSSSHTSLLHIMNGSEDDSEAENEPKIEHQQSTSSQSYVVIADRSGRVSFIHLSTESSATTLPSSMEQDMRMETDSNAAISSSITPRKVFQSCPLGSLVDRVPVGIDAHPLAPVSTTSPPLPPPRRYVTAVTLSRIGGDVRTSDAGDETVSEGSVCLVTVFNTGDIVVYQAITATATADTPTPIAEAPIICFQKLGHSLITRQKKIRTVGRMKRNSSGGGSTGRPVDQYLDIGGLSTSQAMLSVAMDTHGRQAVVVSGARPLLVCNTRGMVQVSPLCLPELPYAGVGVHVSNYFNTGITKGYTVLWREDKVENSTGSITSLATLGLYTETEGILQLPGSNTSVIRTTVGRTTHKVSEFTATKTDDSTQKALLKTKTFAMLCSEKATKKWNNDIFSTEERTEEEGTYDRFYKKMQSFCEPMSELGPPPLLEEDLYSICIMQSGGVVVDKFPLPPGERVLDMTIVYLTVETTESAGAAGAGAGAGAGAAGGNTTSEDGKKKAFVVVCSSIDDKHGEDTQGEGRLLLFSLDYALYQEDQEESMAVSDSVAEAKEDSSDGQEEGEKNEEAGNTDDPSAAHTTVTPSAPTNTTTTTSSSSSSSSSAQARFLGAIKPKLRLLWTGPGPGSVVVPFKDNYILATVGATLYVYLLNTETMELEQIAFFFAQFYISTLSIMKDYILVGDAFQSVQFVVWREEDRSLTLLAKDYDRSACVAANYVLDGETLAFVVSDDEANMQLMRFNPK